MDIGKDLEVLSIYPISGGMELDSLFWERKNHIKLSKLPTERGIGPVNVFLFIEITRRLSRFPISVGMEPEIK